MGAVLRRVFSDSFTDQQACVALSNAGTRQELAQWIADHTQYTATTIAEWIGCGPSRVKDLRAWALKGFQGKSSQANRVIIVGRKGSIRNGVELSRNAGAGGLLLTGDALKKSRKALADDERRCDRRWKEHLEQEDDEPVNTAESERAAVDYALAVIDSLSDKERAQLYVKLKETFKW